MDMVVVVVDIAAVVVGLSGVVTLVVFVFESIQYPVRMLTPL